MKSGKNNPNPATTNQKTTGSIEVSSLKNGITKCVSRNNNRDAAEKIIITESVDKELVLFTLYINNAFQKEY
jgi:hypothetical protein